MRRAWRKCMFLWKVAIAISLRYHVESCIEEERLALLELKSYMEAHVIPGSVDVMGFGVGDTYDCCDGMQVQCNPTTGRVTALDLWSVAYTLDPQRSWLFNMTFFKPFEELISLGLSRNGITGLAEMDGLCKLKNLLTLDLSENMINGGVPSCLQNLSSLQHLDLSGNSFEGKLSLSTFANFSQLQVLDLSRNQLEVETEDVPWQPAFQLQFLGLGGCSLNCKLGRAIPKFLTHQFNLSYIDLSDNGLLGTFPTWLFSNNSMLDTVLLRNNSLTGYFQLPPYTDLCLVALDISSNDIQGVLPENISFLLPGLKFLNMSRNRMEGNIPSSMGNMTELTTLNLSYNNFSGELPKSLLSDCSWLGLLILSNNSLEGDIIPQYMNLPKLMFLELSNNQFGGTIKDSLLNSPLVDLRLSNNKVTGLLPNWISNLSQLHVLSISNNNLQGQIPTEICSLHDLKYLDLSLNNFTGPVPSCSNFSSLSYLHLQKNNLTGPIPSALLSGSDLITLDLRDNQLSGSIPSWSNKLLRLQVLLLGGNNLDGKIPPQLCELRDIDILDLSRNQLSGGLLACFGNMSFGVRSIAVNEGTQVWNIAYSLDKPYYADVMFLVAPEEVGILLKNQYMIFVGGVLQLMSGLDLSGNKLSGVIPQELGDLSRVHSLNLSHNCLSGSIPSSFSNLKQIESLDLSYNNLNGVIPQQLVELNFLEIFNVSYNNLTGRTPDSGQFADFDDYNYLGNPRLCGSTLRNSCNPNPPAALPPPFGAAKQDGDAALDMEDFLWSFGMSSFVAFMATVAVLGINLQWREAWFDFVEWHLLWWLL